MTATNAQAPIDVPNLLKATAAGCICSASGHRPSKELAREQANVLMQAHDAVAEMIERDKSQREALETCERWFVQHSPTAPLIGGLGEAEHPMLTMIRAALARAQGGTK